MLRLHSEGGGKDSLWQAFKKIIEIKKQKSTYMPNNISDPRKRNWITYVYRNQHDVKIQAMNFVKVESRLAELG